MDHQAFAQLVGNYGEFLGAIGVIVTLGYLAVQIRQNTKSLDENRKVALVDSYVRRSDVIERSMMQAAASGDLAKIVSHHADQGLDALTSVERARLVFWERARMMRLESQYYQHQQGLLDDEYYEHQFKKAVARVAPKWKELGIEIERPSFRTVVDEILTETPH